MSDFGSHLESQNKDKSESNYSPFQCYQDDLIDNFSILYENNLGPIVILKKN